MRRRPALAPFPAVLARALAAFAASLLAMACSAPPSPAPRVSATAPPPRAAPVVDQNAPLNDRMQVFGRARAEERDGRSAEARRDYALAEQVLPELADHSLFRGAELARRDGDLPQARVKYDRLLAEHGESVWAQSAAVERGRIALDDGDAGAAAALFDRAIATEEPARLDEAKLGKAEAAAQIGDARGSYEMVDELRGKPDRVGSEARVLGESLEARGPAALGLDGDELDLRMARARLREGRLDDSARALAAIGPGSPRHGEALLVLARVRAKQGDVDGALAAYEEASRSSTAPETAGTALYEGARLQWNRDQDDAAERGFRALLERFPTHEKAPDALNALGRIAETRGDLRGAARLYEEFGVRFPSDPLAPDLAWRAGFVRYLAGDQAGAASTFAALGDGDEAVYWRARALAAGGDSRGARALYESLQARAPDGYLAWWVDRQLGRPPAQPRTRAGDLPDPPAALTAPPPPLGDLAVYHYSRGEVLRALDLRGDAAREYAAVEAVAGPQPFLLDLYRDTESYPAMIRLARRLAGPDPHPADAYLYPRAFTAEFAQAGDRSGVDPLLLLAVARQESLFDAAARSSAGARGLMQVMPATAAAVAGAGADEGALAAPSSNASIGGSYLRHLLDRYDGRLVPAIAAYNAGPGPVERWQARAAGRSGDEFVELISYRETKQYVKAVLRNYRVYLELYGDGTPPDRSTTLY